MLPLLYAVSLLAGCAGVLFENASMTVVPETTANLSRANGRMLASRTLGQSLLGKAAARRLVSIGVHDLRQWTDDVHRTVDDAPYGVQHGSTAEGGTRVGAGAFPLRTAASPSDPLRCSSMDTGESPRPITTSMAVARLSAGTVPLSRRP